MSLFTRLGQRIIDAAWYATHATAGAGQIRNENTLTTLTVEELAEQVREALGGQSSAGVTVTPLRALQNPAYYATVIVLAETVAQIPFNVMRRTRSEAGVGAEVAEDAPLHRLLSKRGRPNGWQSSVDFRHLMMWQLLNRHNFYAFKGVVNGELRELLPIVGSSKRPREVKVEQLDNFDLEYTVTGMKGGQRKFGRAEIFHVMGPSEDGFQGLNPMHLLGDAVGLGIAQDTYAGKMFANSLMFSGLLKHPGELSEKAWKQLDEQIKSAYGGLENAHKLAILEEGMEFQPTSQNAEQAQLDESRKHQRAVIASQRRVPPHMIGELDKATFSNIENLARQFIDFAVMPKLELIEAGCDLQLLTEREREQGLFSKFNASALLRGDSFTRARVYMMHRQMGSMSPNEVREKEDMNPREDPGGASYDNPNTTPGGDPDVDSTDGPGERRPGESDESPGERRARLSLVNPEGET